MKKTIREVEVGDSLWKPRKITIHKARVLGVCDEVCFYLLCGEAIVRIATFTALGEEGWEFYDPDDGRAEEAIKTLKELGRIKDGKIIE